MSQRVWRSSRSIADSIGTSLMGERVGLAPSSIDAKVAPSGRDCARGPPDVPAEVEARGSPWLEAFCRGKSVSEPERFSVDGLPSGHNSSTLEGLGLLWGEPPARAAPRERTRCPGWRMGGCGSLTADARVVGLARSDMMGKSKEIAEILRDPGRVYVSRLGGGGVSESQTVPKATG